jgi:hypothetical protein
MTAPSISPGATSGVTSNTRSNALSGGPSFNSSSSSISEATELFSELMTNVPVSDDTSETPFNAQLSGQNQEREFYDLFSRHSDDSLKISAPLIAPTITIAGKEEEIPGIPPGAQIITESFSDRETDAGNSFYQIGQFGKLAYGDNIMVNAMKVPVNAATNMANQVVDLANIPIHDAQYLSDQISEKGFWGGLAEYGKARAEVEWNWLKSAGNAMDDLVQHGPANVMNAITDPDWDAVGEFLKSPLYAENWESATELGMAMVVGKNPGKLVDDFVESPFPELKSVGAAVNKQYDKLSKIANQAYGAKGKQASQLLQKMANKAGLIIESGGKHLKVVDASGNVVTTIPHSPHSKGTIKSIASAIMNAAGF